MASKIGVVFVKTQTVVSSAKQVAQSIIGRFRGFTPSVSDFDQQRSAANAPNVVDVALWSLGLPSSRVMAKVVHDSWLTGSKR